MKFLYKNIHIEALYSSKGYWTLVAALGELSVKAHTFDEALINRQYNESDKIAWVLIEHQLWKKFANSIFVYHGFRMQCNTIQRVRELISALLNMEKEPCFKLLTSQDTHFDEWDKITSKLELGFDEIDKIYFEPNANLYLVL